jgi:deoxycytidine triphosphate deaminase
MEAASMPAVDLTRRVTRSEEDFERFRESADSLIFVSCDVQTDSLATMDLTVGDTWFDCSTVEAYEVPPDGLALAARRAVVIETHEVLGAPSNIFGMVTGKGRYIFQGLFVSTGKVDPGFFGRLRIGIYNGGHRSVTLKRGEPFCSCWFFPVETTLPAQARKPALAPGRVAHREPWWRCTVIFFCREWARLIPITVSLLALGVAGYNALKKH